MDMFFAQFSAQNCSPNAFGPVESDRFPTRKVTCHLYLWTVAHPARKPLLTSNFDHDFDHACSRPVSRPFCAARHYKTAISSSAHFCRKLHKKRAWSSPRHRRSNLPSRPLTRWMSAWPFALPSQTYRSRAVELLLRQRCCCCCCFRQCKSTRPRTSVDGL